MQTCGLVWFRAFALAVMFLVLGHAGSARADVVFHKLDTATPGFSASARFAGSSLSALYVTAGTEDVYQYNPASQSWETVSSYATHRDGNSLNGNTFQIAASGNIIYVSRDTSPGLISIYDGSDWSTLSLSHSFSNPLTRDVLGIYAQDAQATFARGSGYINIVDNGVDTITSEHPRPFGNINFYNLQGIVGVGSTVFVKDPVNNRFSRSTDSGETWSSAIDISAADFSYGSLYALDANTLYSAGYTSAIQRSTDAGENWSTLNLSGFAGMTRSVYAADANTLYVGGADGVWFSNDAGVTWSILNSELDGYTNQDIRSIYAVDDHIFFSASSGEMWTAVGTPLPAEWTLTPGPEINVGSSLTTPPLNQYQSDLRCHPTDPDQMVITAKNGSEEHTLAFKTADGGETWTVTRQSISGDPECFYGNNGWAHWFYMNRSPQRIGYRRLKEADGVWETGRIISNLHIDHPHAAVDRHPQSPFYGNIYLAGRVAARTRIEALRSSDDGDTWASTDFNPGSAYGQGFVDGPLLVMKDGTLIVYGRSQNRILVEDGVYAGSRRDIFAFRSTDGGVTFSSAILVCDLDGVINSRPGSRSISGGIVEVNGIERIVIVLSRVRTNRASVLQIVTSDDGGLTWTEPRQIRPPWPSNSWSAGGMISVMVNQDNVIGLQYFNLLHQSSTFNVMFIYSVDGGETWSTPTQVNTQPLSAPPANTQSREPGGDQVLGDVAADGSFRLVWPDHRTGDNIYRLYHRSVSVVQNETNTHTLNYSAGPGGSITGPAAQEVTHGSDGAPVTAVPDAGAVFMTWDDDWPAANRQDLEVDTPLDVTALFASAGGVPITWYAERVEPGIRRRLVKC